jgi:hypothetical protein
MSEDAPDTTTLSGAQFQRHAGTSAARWAEALVAAYDREGVHKEPRETRALFVEVWLRDYAEVCVAEEVGRVTARLVPRHDD